MGSWQKDSGTSRWGSSCPGCLDLRGPLGMLGLQAVGKPVGRPTPGLLSVPPIPASLCSYETVPPTPGERWEEGTLCG